MDSKGFEPLTPRLWAGCTYHLCYESRTRILSALKVCWWRVYPVVISLLTVWRRSPSCHNSYRFVFRPTCTDGWDPVYYSQSSFCLPFLELVSAQLRFFIQPTTSSQPMSNQLYTVSWLLRYGFEPYIMCHSRPNWAPNSRIFLRKMLWWIRTTRHIYLLLAFTHFATQQRPFYVCKDCAVPRKRHRKKGLGYTHIRLWHSPIIFTLSPFMPNYFPCLFL